MEMLERARACRFIPSRLVINFIVVWLSGSLVVVCSIADLRRDFAEYHSEVLPGLMKFCHILYSILEAIVMLVLVPTLWVILALVLAILML